MKKIIILLLLLTVTAIPSFSQISANYNDQGTSVSVFLHTKNETALFVNTDVLFNRQTFIHSFGVLFNDKLGVVYSKLFIGLSASTNATHGNKYGGTLGMYVGTKHVYFGYKNVYGNSYTDYGSVSVLISL